MKLLALLAVLSLAGCAVVPATKFSINPTNGVVTVDSPKDVSFTNLDASMPNGSHIVLQGYKSVNSPDVIAAVANANAQMADKIIKAMELWMSMAEKGALASPRKPTGTPDTQ